MNGSEEQQVEMGREKIADLFREARYQKDFALKTSEEYAKQIQALFPFEGKEDVRKDERERILSLFYNKFSEIYQGSRNTPANVNLLKTLFEFVQAQKDEK